MLTTDLALRVRPGVREDLAPLPGEPRRVRAGLRQGLVQAAAPRHGPGRRATSARGSPSRSCGRTRCRPSRASSSATPTSPPSRRRSSTPACPSPQLVSHRLGLGRELPLHRQARRRQRRPHPPRAAARLGGQPARAARAGPRDARGASRREFNGAGGAQVSLADLIVLAGSAAVEKAAQGRRRRGDRAVPRRAAPTPRRSRPTSTRSRCSSRAPTGSATTCGPARSCSRRRCSSTGPTCST